MRRQSILIMNMKLNALLVPLTIFSLSFYPVHAEPLPIDSETEISAACQTDIDNLNRTIKQGDFEGLISAGNALKDKWRKVDVQDYDAVLNALCVETTYLVYDSKYESRLRGIRDAYAMEGLAAGNTPLYERAFLAERLMYRPSECPESDAGATWPAMRRERLAIWLEVYKELRSQVVALTPCEMPATPDRKYFKRFVAIDGNFNPDTITDPIVKANYIAAYNRYLSYEHDSRRQMLLSKILFTFTGQFKVSAVAAYCYPPYNFRELRRSLDTAHVDKDTRDYILKQDSRDSGDADRTFTYSVGT